MLSGLDEHPHARAVLSAAVPPAGTPSHAYLFHGPAGSGKRAAARRFAAELLADGVADPASARRRVMDDVHPDLTWVAPTSSAGVLVDDVADPVVKAATRTPFEATRRVFVIEAADTLNDQAANRMLKTLEEPPPYAHLVLLAPRPSAVMPTIASRCQLVRFEAPGAEELARRLASRGVAPAAADACARLGLGDGERALWLALGEGPALRAAAETFARACVSGDLARAPWTGLLEAARTAGAAAGETARARIEGEAELLPDREARKLRKDGETTVKRAERREQTHVLGVGLSLVACWMRDIACMLDGAPEVVHHTDRRDLLAQDAQSVALADRARAAVADVEELRTLLVVNPSEELALEALASRLERLLARV